MKKWGVIFLKHTKGQSEAVNIWKTLKGKVNRLIDARTASCLRMKRLVVVTEPNGSTLGVMQPNDTQIFNIPYASSLSTTQVGDTVLVVYWYGMTNAFAIANGNLTTNGG